jgi:hypothetical protein
MDENEIMNQNVNIIEEENDIDIIETVDFIDVENTEALTVDSLSAFPAVGESNEYLKHQLLNGRELDDQHPITAITGLRGELDYIESLKTVYSDKRRHANYYLWEDANLLQEEEDRSGYFVALCENMNQIKICTDNDVFGVVVEDAGFIGGQDDIARDYKYGLVADTGVVAVRCELDVKVGDSVISNEYGVAKKSDNEYGYKVVALEDVNGVICAIIDLSVSIKDICSLGNESEILSERMDAAAINIVAAMNVANAAYNKAAEAGVGVEGAIGAANNAVQQAGEVINATNNMQTQIELINQTSVQAKAIAESAVTSADAIRSEAVSVANDALTNVNGLIEDLEPISLWGVSDNYITVDTWDSADKDTSQTYYAKDTGLYYFYYQDDWRSISEVRRGAEYLTNYIKDDLATKTEIYTVETLTEDNKSAIEKNAESITSMVSSVDKYSIGEYSQAYGLTLEQARSILKEGYVYIPIKQGRATYTHNEQYDDSTDQIPTFYFSCGFYYIWDGEWWVENNTQCVALPYINELGNQIPVGNNSLKFWFIDSETAPDGYEPMALYMWTETQDNSGETVWTWVKVNVIAGNANNRLTSMIRQTAGEISIDVANTKGSVAYLGARVDNTESSVQTLASHVIGEYVTLETWNDAGKDTSKIYYTKDTKLYYYYEDNEWKSTKKSYEAGLEGTMATIQEKADDDGASIAQVVRAVGENGQVNAASIVTAINNSGSSVVIGADHVNIEGKTINLRSGKFSIDSDYFDVTSQGVVTATRGTIGGWNIDGEKMWNTADVDGVPHSTILAAYDNDLARSRVFRCTRYYGTNNATDVFTIRRNGEVCFGNTDGRWIVANPKLYPGELEFNTSTSTTRMCATFIEAISATGEDDARVYNGIGVSASLKVDDNIYLNRSRYLKCEYGSYYEAVGMTHNGHLSIGANDQPGHTNIKTSSGNQIGFYVDGTQMAYVDSEGLTIKNGKLNLSGDVSYSGSLSVGRDIILKNNMCLYGKNTDGVDQILIFRNGYNNIQIGTATNNQGVALFANSDQGIGFFIDNKKKVEIKSSGIIVNDVSTTSDERKKNSIKDLDDRYIRLLDNLSAKTYKFNEHRTDVINCGFIAQEVLSALSDVGLSQKEFGGFVDVNGDGSEYALDYSQFIPIMWEEIKSLRARVFELENKEN